MHRVGWKCSGFSLLGVIVLGVGVLTAVLVIRTYTLPHRDALGKGAPDAALGDVERRQLIEALKGAIRIPTVSFSEEEQNTTALAEFGDYIRKVFPQVFSSNFIKHEIVGGYSHLLSVRGSDTHLLPYMLLAHLDVVPAPPESWEVPPFSAEERGGYIYGRGTLDDKNCVIEHSKVATRTVCMVTYGGPLADLFTHGLPLEGILQSLEFLLKRNYKPRRSFYIGIGHDEEVSGHKGAMKIVEKLESRGVKLAFVLDEGLAVLDGVIKGVTRPVALIGTTEKGSITLNLTVNRPPGHSSIPPSETSIGILAAAVSRLEQNPMPNMFGEGPEGAMFEHLVSEFVFPLNIMMANLWLFSPIISRILERSPASNAIVRTTTALTMFNAGIKSNVIPSTAKATVNFRVHPAQTVNEVLDLLRNTVRDERVELSVLNSFNPLPVSPYDEESFGYHILQQTIQAVFSEAPVAPGVCVGNTDSRHFVNLTNSIYRFSPVVLKQEDVNRIHGLNERISLEGFEHLVQFYYKFIQNADSDNIPKPHRATHEL